MATETLRLAIELAEAGERAEAAPAGADAEAKRLLKKHPTDDVTPEEVADILRDEANRPSREND